MNTVIRDSPEVRDRAVRRVIEHQGESESPWAAIVSLGAKIGGTAETRRQWVRQAEHAQGLGNDLSAEERGRLKALERENRERRRANEIYAKQPLFSPRRSSAATGRDAGGYRPTSGPVRGRADRRTPVNRPVY